MKQQEYFNEHSSAWKENQAFALWLVEKVQPDVTLDLGVDWGHSTMSWAQPGIGNVYGVDIWTPNSYSTVGHNYDEFVSSFKEFYKQGLNNITLIRGDHKDVESTWDKEVDIMHFDILHDYVGVKKEYELWSKHLKEDGVTLFHDLISFSDGVGKFFREDLQLPRVEFNNQYGLGVMTVNEALLSDIESEFDVTRIQ
jgi:hypothetical protein